jgi:cell division protein FtsQ
VAVRRTSSPRARTAVVPLSGGGAVRTLASVLPSARAVLVAALLVGAGAGAYVAARKTSAFELRAIEVRGASPGTAGELRAALAPLLGESLLSLDGDALVRRAEAIPQVAAAHYDRAFPHTLMLTVLEERPAAVLRRGAQAWLVAESGRVLRPVSRSNRSFPRVWTGKGRPIVEGEPIADAVAARAIAAVARVPDRFPARVRDVRTGPEELTLKLVSGLELRLGDDSELELKLAIAGRILPTLAAPADGGPTYFDVSVVERPVTGGNSQLEGGG